MRAVTVAQPWGWACGFAGCDVLSLRFPAPSEVVGERIALHAAKHVPKEYRGWLDAWGDGEWYPEPIDDVDPDSLWPHAGVEYDADDRWWRLRWNPKYLGAVVAVATVTDCHIAWFKYDLAGDPDTCCESEWGTGHELRPDESMTTPNVYHWRLADVTVLAEPIPMRGHTGCWTVDNQTAADVEVDRIMATWDDDPEVPG